MIRRLSHTDAIEMMLDGADDAVRMDVALMAALSTRDFGTVRELRNLATTIERHAGDLEDAHYRHLDTVTCGAGIPGEACVPLSPLPRHLAPGADHVSGVFSHPPADMPLADLDPAGGHAPGETILPEPSLRARFLAWSAQVDRSWTGSVLATAAFVVGAYLLILFLGVLT